MHKIETNEDSVGGLSNNRKIQPIQGHDIKYVGARYFSKVAAVTMAFVSPFVIWSLA